MPPPHPRPTGSTRYRRPSASAVAGCPCAARRCGRPRAWRQPGDRRGPRAGLAQLVPEAGVHTHGVGVDDQTGRAGQTAGRGPVTETPGVHPDGDSRDARHPGMDQWDRGAVRSHRNPRQGGACTPHPAPQPAPPPTTTRPRSPERTTPSTGPRPRPRRQPPGHQTRQGVPQWETPRSHPTGQANLPAPHTARSPSTRHTITSAATLTATSTKTETRHTVTDTQPAHRAMSHTPVYPIRSVRRIGLVFRHVAPLRLLRRWSGHRRARPS